MSSNNHTKIAIVTGAGHRVGAEIAKTVVKLGYTLILHYYSSEKKTVKLSNSLNDTGGVTFPFKADLTDESEMKHLWGFIDGIKGELKLLVNSASIMPGYKFGNLTSENFDQVIAINLRAPLLCSQEAAKRMTSGAQIINISDIAAKLGWTGYPLYSVSRSALDSLTRIMAKDLAPDIRVNGIAPGLVIPSEGMETSDWELLVKKVPLMRSASVEELTMAIKFLIENEYITGQIITIDGGRTL